MICKAHPAADLFPLLPEPELRELMDDIKANGQRDPIVMLDGMVLDGRNRYQACHFLGIEPRTIEWDNDGDPVLFVVSKNIHRRHLTPGQRGFITESAKELVAGMEARSSARRAAGNRLGGLGGKSKANLPSTGGQTRDELAKLANVSPRTQEHAKRVVNSGIAELMEAVKSGEVAVSAASDISDLPAAEIRRAVADGTVSSKASEIRNQGRDTVSPHARWFLSATPEEQERFFEMTGTMFTGVKQ